MAYTNNAAAPASAPSAQSADWKADAFLNIYVPKADGTGRTKIGAIPLKNMRKFDAALIERFSNDPEAILKMKDVLELDFQVVGAGPAPVLPF